MKKYFFILLCLIFCFISGVGEDFSGHESDGANATFLSSENVIYATEAPADKFSCYSTMKVSKGSRVLECNNPCCYKSGYTGEGLNFDKCTGHFNDCAGAA